MAAFLTIAEIKTHIYPNVSTLVSQGDASILQDAINAATTEAKGYCSRYRVEQLFENADASAEYLKDPILLMHVKNMAKWHFCVLGTPAIDYEDAQTRYDQAVKWLKEVQAGRAVPPGWPPAQPVEQSKLVHMSSNKKRNNHF